MREDCDHFETRTYDDGEVARFCTKDLAPEAPWKCPEHCGGYERIQMITGDFDKGSLGNVPAVEDEPDEPPQDIADVLAEAETIVNDAAPSVVADLDKKSARRSWWSRKKRGEDGDDFNLSNR
jgi:hypothetical protein